MIGAPDIDISGVATTCEEAHENALLTFGQSATAKRDALKAISLDPNIGAAQNALAIANITLSKYTDAAAPARRAVDSNPYQVRYYQTLARVFMRLGRKKDAEATVKAAQLSNVMQSSGLCVAIKPQAFSEVSRLLGARVERRGEGLILPVDRYYVGQSLQ